MYMGLRLLHVHEDDELLRISHRLAWIANSPCFHLLKLHQIDVNISEHRENVPFSFYIDHSQIIFDKSVCTFSCFH